MFQKIYLDPQNRLFSEMMSNSRRYVVPPFQRDYSWEHEQWEELWQDIEQMRQSNTQHFMGYVVLQTEDERNFQIIDGQQRITTISLLILAVLKKLQALVDGDIDRESNRQRIEEYRRMYVGVFDSVALTTLPKLVLNRHNNRHFQALVERLDAPTRRRMTKTNRTLNRAFDFFVEKLSPLEKDGQKLALLVEHIADGLLFTAITVRDDLNAYTVFETLNARGVHLSTPDLLKNYLLSTLASQPAFSDGDFDDFSERWEGIIEQLGETEFTHFLHSHWEMADALQHKGILYKTLKREIDVATKVVPYLRKLEDRAPVYAALQEPHDDFWLEGKGQYTQARPHLEILKLFGVKTPLSLLMAGYEKFSPQDFIRLLNCIGVLTIRYNVICERVISQQARVYNRTANQLMRENLSLREVIDGLSPIYPRDAAVQSSFGNKRMPSRRSAKKIAFLLRAIEKHVSGQDTPSTLTLEHILPYNPDDDWQVSFGRETYESAIDRLGNMALLPRSQNMGQETFEKKREILRKSNYRINQRIAEYAEWNMACLSEHQQWLARQVVAVWKIAI